MGNNIKLKQFTLNNPMPPPWLMYPEIPLGSIGWRMGYGENYLDHFNQWFSNLNKNEQDQYDLLFPKPKHWCITQSQLDFNSTLLWAEDTKPAYSQTQLLQQQSARQTFIFFWGNQPSKDGVIKKSCLSQWWLSDFQANAGYYCCMEQYMMSQKARLFDDQEIHKKIMSTQSQHEIKTLGRQVKNFDCKIWNKTKYAIVLNGNYYKFFTQKPLRDYLLSTQDNILVEASPYDKIWGIGLSENDNNIDNPVCWKGQNLLGFALMEVRDEIQRIYQNQNLIDWEMIKALFVYK